MSKLFWAMLSLLVACPFLLAGRKDWISSTIRVAL